MRDPLWNWGLVFLLALCILLLALTRSEAQPVRYLDLPRVTYSDCHLRFTNWAVKEAQSGVPSRYLLEQFDARAYISNFLMNYSIPLRLYIGPYGTYMDTCRIQAEVDVDGADALATVQFISGCLQTYPCTIQFAGTWTGVPPLRIPTSSPLASPRELPRVGLQDFYNTVLPASRFPH